MRNGIPIFDIFSDPRPFAYSYPHMHAVLPICEIMHMGVKDIISHMEMFLICIRLVTKKIPICIQGCANPCMHTGISVHAIPTCIRRSP
jgi:hypothetical protein